MVFEKNTVGRLFCLCVPLTGNVLNSGGSVLPVFRDQIASGGPVTVCGLCIIIALLMTQIIEKKSKLVLIPLAGLFFIIILSGSRGAILMILGMIGYWLFISMKNRKLFTFIITILIIFCVYFIFEDHISLYLLSRLNVSSVLKDGGSGRIKIWGAALRAFKNSTVIHMIFGYGHGSFREAVNYVAVGHSGAYQAHNIFINALVEGGLLGLILLILAFVQVFKYASKNHNTWGCLSIIGFFMEGLSLDAQSYRVFAIAFVIAVIYSDTFKDLTDKKMIVTTDKIDKTSGFLIKNELN